METQPLACGFDKTNPIYQERTRKVGAKLASPPIFFQNIPAFEDGKQRTVSSDTLRCHEMKIGVLRNNQRPALESLLRKSHAPIIGGPEPSAKTQAVEDARRWFADPASRPAIMKVIEDAGYPPNAVEVEAFQLALPVLAPIERLIVSAQKRLDQYLKELEKSSKGRAEALRLATVKAINAKDSAIVKKAN
jgi:hypothetical protein